MILGWLLKQPYQIISIHHVFCLQEQHSCFLTLKHVGPYDFNFDVNPKIYILTVSHEQDRGFGTTARQELGSDVDPLTKISTVFPRVFSPSSLSHIHMFLQFGRLAQDSEKQTQQTTKYRCWDHVLKIPMYSNHIIFVRINHFDRKALDWNLLHLEPCCQAAYSNHHKVKNHNTNLSSGSVYTNYPVTGSVGTVTMREL